MAATSGAMILTIVVNVNTSFSTSKFKPDGFSFFQWCLQKPSNFLFGLLSYHILERVGNNYTGESVFRNLLKSSGLIDKDSIIPEAPFCWVEAESEDQ
jgi:hypothetical protein